MISLCDTPGFMVGPEAEQTAQVRHFGRMFVAGASLTVPFVTVILRKAVGLGAMAMSAGSMHSTLLSVAWPTGEVSGMGIEGAVKHGARRELDAIDDLDDREARYDELVERMYDASKRSTRGPRGDRRCDRSCRHPSSGGAGASSSVTSIEGEATDGRPVVRAMPSPIGTPRHSG